MGDHYNEGYLAGEAAGVVFVGGVMRDAPTCPYPEHTRAQRAWFAGLIDRARDRKPPRLP